ncbi:MAG: dihydropyrimidinase [Caldilineaceae bacterium]|nr:dihydropyrimidinase [Caldilineaceae bacterium]
MLLITNGQLITPDGVVEADLAIDGQEIAAIGRGLTGERVIDAAGCYVLPGGVDPHVHLQMPLAGRVSTDTFLSGSIAAAHGGTTTFIDFVTPEPEQSMLDALHARQAEADGETVIDYGLHMTIPTWHGAEETRLKETTAAVAAGCATFKLYQAYTGMVLDDPSLLRAFQAIARAGGLAVLHSETGPVLELLRSQALAAGYTAPIWHERTRPARLEATAIHRAAELADLAQCPLHIFHVGCAEAVAEITRAQAAGIDISGESCPQYLLLTAEEHLAGPDGALFICAPPLRNVSDHVPLWRGLANGALAMVSTDHCPWTRAEKDQPDFSLVPGGVPGIETRLSLIYHHGVRTGLISPSRWVEICCTEPARRMGLSRKGRLAPGYDADVVIFDPTRRRTLSVNTLHELCDWTPYAGMTLTGWPRTVLQRGRLLVEEEEFVGAPGDGTFIKRAF